MKRFGTRAFTAVLALVFVLSLAGCGRKAGNDGPMQADPSAPGLLGNAVGAATDPEGGQTSQAGTGGEQKRRQFLVEDRSLYEKMVRGRYYDVWSRRGTYFTNLDLFLYDQFLDKMQENVVAYWDAEAAGALASTFFVG